MTDNKERKAHMPHMVQWQFGTLLIRAGRYGIEFASYTKNWIRLADMDDFLALLNDVIATAKAITKDFEDPRT
jgi:hypothetical protein